MKKNILMITGCSILISISSLAYSAQGPYMSGNLGYAIMSNSEVTDSTVPGITAHTEIDPGLAVGVAAGYGFANNTRLECEIAYQKNDLNKAKVKQLSLEVPLTGDTSSLALLLNGYYDFRYKTVFTFITAGLGFAKVEINDLNVPGSGLPSVSDDDTVFAYQFGIGWGFTINERTIFDIKYRYFSTADPNFDTTSAQYSSHNFYAGIRVNF